MRRLDESLGEKETIFQWTLSAGGEGEFGSKRPLPKIPRKTSSGLGERQMAVRKCRKWCLILGEVRGGSFTPPPQPFGPQSLPSAPNAGGDRWWRDTAFTAPLKKPVIHDLSKSWDWPVGGVGLSCVCFIGALRLCMTFHFLRWGIPQEAGAGVIWGQEGVFDLERKLVTGSEEASRG